MSSNDTITVRAYCAHNLGDDLFLETLFSRYASASFEIVASPDYADSISRFKNVKVIDITKLADAPLSERFQAKLEGIALSNDFCLLMSSVRQSKALVVIGGSMYQQQEDERLQKQILFETRHLYKSPEHTFVIGANFGPYWNDEYREAYRKIFTRYCDDVCFRDQWSKLQFPGASNIRTASDVLFAFPMPKRAKRRQVFFSVCDLSLMGRPDFLRAKSAQYEQWIADIAEELYVRNYQIVFGAFCAIENDGVAVSRIQKILQSRGVPSESIIYQNDSNPMIDAISSSEIVIATRFHATILGLISGAKVLPLIYNVKTNNMLNDIATGKILRVDLLSENPENWPQDVDTLVGLEPVNVNRQIADAKRQFAALDAFLYG